MRIYDIRDNGKDAELQGKVFSVDVLGLRSSNSVCAGISGHELRNRDYADLCAEVTEYAERQLNAYNRINSRLKHKPCKNYSIVAAGIYNHGFEIVLRMNG